MAGQDQRAVLVRKFDQEHYLDNLEVGRRPKPQPKDGEVLIRMLARPVDPAGEQDRRLGVFRNLR